MEIMFYSMESQKTGFCTLAEALKQMGISYEKNPPPQTDEPIIIPAESLQETDAEQLLTERTIIITDPLPEDIQSFCKNTPAAVWPHDAQADFIAVRFDNQGNFYTFVQLHKDTEEIDSQYASALIQWLHGEFDAGAVLNDNQTFSHLDLVRLARAYVTTFNFDLFGKSMILNLYAVSCHVFSKSGSPDSDLGDDFFYLHETCHFDGGKSNDGYSYEKYWEPLRAYLYGGKYWVGAGEVCRHYIHEYLVYNTLDTDFPNAAFLHFAPVAANDQQQITVSTGFDISGSISAKLAGQGNELGAELGMGGNFSQSETMNVRDCTVSTEMSRQGHKIAWHYVFRHARQNKQAGRWQFLLDPAALSHTLAQFEQHWIWKLPTNQRAGKSHLSFTVDCSGHLISTISRNSGSISEQDIYGPWKNQALRVQIEWPSLLASDARQVEMSREGGEKQIRLGCEGAWISSVNADWLSCTPPQGGRGEDTSLFLLAAENTTGQTRQARLTVKRLAGSEVQTVLVTQYAK